MYITVCVCMHAQVCHWGQNVISSCVLIIWCISLNMWHREWHLRGDGPWIITYISVCDSFSDRFCLCSTENVFSFCLVWQCFVPRCIMGRLGVVLISWAGGEIMRRGQAVKANDNSVYCLSDRFSKTSWPNPQLWIYITKNKHTERPLPEMVI